MALIKAGKKFQRFHHAQLLWQGSGLQRRANFVFEFFGIFLRIEAADGDAAAVWGAYAFQNLHRGGLAGAVRAEQSEDFALFHVEADAAHGLHVAVVLDEMLYLQDGIGHI